MSSVGPGVCGLRKGPTLDLLRFQAMEGAARWTGPAGCSVDRDHVGVADESDDAQLSMTL